MTASSFWAWCPAAKSAPAPCTNLGVAQKYERWENLQKDYFGEPLFLLKTHFKGKSGTPKFLGIWRVTTCRVIVRLAFAVWGTTGPLTCAVRCFGDLSARGSAAHLTSIFFTARCIGQGCVLHLASGMSCNHIALSSHGTWTQRQTDEVALERPKSQIFTEQSWCRKTTNHNITIKNNTAEPFVLVHQAVCWFQILKGNLLSDISLVSTHRKFVWRLLSEDRTLCQMPAECKYFSPWHLGRVPRKSCHRRARRVHWFSQSVIVYTLCELGPKPTNKL